MRDRRSGRSPASPASGAARRATSRRGILDDRRRAKDEAARAISAFLDAVAPPDVRRSEDVRATPERVAEAWFEELLDGYRQDPAELLAGEMPSKGEDLVAVTAIDFHAMCPHHLLPWRGLAHVAYVPKRRVVGFGQIARLVDCFAHRLALQEDVARQVAEALMVHLGARGAACILDAEQACLSVRGARRREARAQVQCFMGVLESDVRLQARVLALAQRGPRRGRR